MSMGRGGGPHTRGFAAPSPRVLSSDDQRPGRDGVYSGADPTRQGRVFVCTVPWGDAGTLVVMTNGVPESQFDTYKAGVQAIVESARYLP